MGFKCAIEVCGFECDRYSEINEVGFAYYDDNTRYLCDEHRDEYVESVKSCPEFHQLTLAPTFYDDHVSRGLPAGVEIRRTQRGVTIMADLAVIREIRSDARHHVWNGANGAFDSGEYGSLVQSAKAVVRKIDKFYKTQEAA